MFRRISMSCLFLIICSIRSLFVDGFVSPLQVVWHGQSMKAAQSAYYLSSNNKEDVSYREQAEILLAKARKLRSETEGENYLGSTVTKDKAMTTEQKSTTTTIPQQQHQLSKWSVESSADESSTSGLGYRLYIDIGREEGTWMEPRWGASVNRIELTLDVEFTKLPASETEAERLISDNILGKKSRPYVLKSANIARLRQGFDTMKCNGGAYRIDTSGNNRQTIRLYVNAEGKEDPSFGDITIPTGGLYFSLPCFGGGGSGRNKNVAFTQLSSKEGIVTVRQMGWNTGWRREESRIVGIFYAKPIEEARRRDGF